MYLRIEDLPATHYQGLAANMSFSNNKTAAIWQSFMPRKGEFTPSDDKLYSIEVYPNGFFDSFNPNTEFEKWAAVKVDEGVELPVAMQTLLAPEGKYAVFLHRGTPADGPKTYAYIFNEWLPNSGMELDNRPHLAVMGDKYIHNDPNSEEELWIPVK